MNNSLRVFMLSRSKLRTVKIGICRISVPTTRLNLGDLNHLICVFLPPEGRRTEDNDVQRGPAVAPHLRLHLSGRAPQPRRPQRVQPLGEVSHIKAEGLPTTTGGGATGRGRGYVIGAWLRGRGVAQRC